MEIKIFSDNVRNYLYREDYEDFLRERPEVKIDFVKTCGVVHDRFIVIDSDEENEAVYYCGASSKDAGKKMTVVAEMMEGDNKEALRKKVGEMMNNPKLELK